MKRLLATLLAAGLVVGAVLVRRAIDDDAGGGTAGRAGPRVLCAQEVEAACQRLERAGHLTIAAVEAAGITADRLSRGTGDLGADAWLVSGFWPEIVRGNRQRAGLEPARFDASSKVLATQPARMFLRPERAVTTKAHCAPLTWKCVVPMAAQPWTSFGGGADWGLVSLAVPSIDTTSGLVMVASAIGSETGDTNYASNDIVDETDEFLRRFARDSTSTTDALTPVESMVLTAGSVDITGGLRTDARGEPQGSVEIEAPTPPATVGVVLAGSTRGLDLADVGDALVGTGWSRATSTARITTGLPRPDVMDAVRSDWKASHS